MKYKLLLLLTFFFSFISHQNKVFSCSPYATPLIQHTLLNGNLNLTVTSTSPWQCCYVFEMELICQQANFSGIANLQPNIQVCKGSGNGASSSWSNENYPIYSYPLSNLCPGITYKYRVRERHVNYSYWSEWSAIGTFMVTGDPYAINISADPVVVCPPDCTTLTASSTANCGPVTYTWNQGLGSGAVKTVCPTTPTTYAVTGSVQVPMCPVAITQTTSVYIQIDDPAIPGVATANPTVICQGESSSLSLMGHYGFIQWQSSNDASGPFTDIPGATSTNYIFNSDLNSENTYFRAQVYTCTDEYTVPVLVEVFDTPQPNFNTENICADASYIFQNTTSNVSPVTTWQWNFGNGATSDQFNPNFFFTPGTYSVSLFAENGAGCSEQITQDITVYPMPEPSFTVNNVCYGSSSTFINTSTVAEPSTITTYQWDIDGDGAINYTSQNFNHYYQFEGTYPTTLTVTTNHGCSGSYSLVTSVFPVPVAQFSTSPVCHNVESSFFDQTTVSNDATSNSIVDWLWTLGDGTSSTEQNPIHTYDEPNNFTVSLTVISNNGCSHNTSQIISVYPIPVASFIGTQLEGCSPIYPVITSTSTVDMPSVINNYHWQLSNGVQQNSSINTFLNTLTNGGNATIRFGVDLTVTTNHGCTHSVNQPDYISVYHNPIASFDWEPYSPNILNTEVDFFNTSLYADSYIWNFGYYAFYGTTNEVNPTFTFPDENPDIYQVWLIANTEEGCADTAYANVEVQDVLLFYVPNTFTPNNDDFNDYFTPVFTSGFEPLTYHLTIFNRWGEVIFESYDAEIGWDGTFGVGSSALVPDGTYTWQITFRETMSDKRHLYRGHINIIR